MEDLLKVSLYIFWKLSLKTAVNSDTALRRFSSFTSGNILHKIWSSGTVRLHLESSKRLSEGNAGSSESVVGSKVRRDMSRNSNSYIIDTGSSEHIWNIWDQEEILV